MGTISHGRNDWLVDSGASKHITGYKESFVNMSEYDSPHKVKLGDDYQYPIKGSGESSYNIDSGKYLKIYRSQDCMKILHSLLWGIGNNPQVSTCEVNHFQTY